MESKSDWNKLYAGLLVIYKNASLTRKVSVLENFKNKKEIICRKLNVIKISDLIRIEKEIKDQQSSKPRNKR